MLASKADAKKTQLKLVFKDDLPSGGLMFTFTSASKEEDRKTVQDALIPFVSANRALPGMTPGAGPSTPAPGTPAGIGMASPGGSGVGSGVSTPAMTTAGATPGVAGSVVGNGKRKADGSPAGVPGPQGADKVGRPINYKLRLRVLNKNPNLKMLHRELVLGKQITEEEFWEGREVCSTSFL
jgi:transcription initiation factor TFIIH subunit 1